MRARHSQQGPEVSSAEKDQGQDCVNSSRLNRLRGDHRGSRRGKPGVSSRDKFTFNAREGDVYAFIRGVLGRGNERSRWIRISRVRFDQGEEREDRGEMDSDVG